MPRNPLTASAALVRLFALTLPVALALALPAAAAALTLTVPAQASLAPDVRLSASPQDSGGIAMLLVDGAFAGSAALATSASTTFTAVPLTPGTHRIGAVVRSARGLTSAPQVTVSAWGPPSAPAVSGLHAGIYHVDSALTVKAGSCTTTITALVAGKTVWRRSVSTGGAVTSTFHLPPGADVVELRASNPGGLVTSAKVTLQCALWPVPAYTSVGSEFGMRSGRMHKGIDIHADFGATVIAIAPGRVIWAEPLTSYGGLVLIDHGGHIVSYYAHLQRIDVKLGQLVKAGDHIATVGNTGNADAGSPHLHFQVYTNALGWADTSDKFRRVNSGIWTDPRLWLGPNPAR